MPRGSGALRNRLFGPTGTRSRRAPEHPSPIRPTEGEAFSRFHQKVVCQEVDVQIELAVRDALDKRSDKA